jgi:uncharacterized protein
VSKQTALITGASFGLGEHFAELFAQDGHDVVLVARTADKLESLAARLREKYQVQATVEAADLAHRESPARIFEAITRRGVAIDFLVNNAGFGSKGAFLELSLDSEAQMIEVNCNALMKLTHLFGRPMRDRKFGRILNIASTAGFQPGPYMATYYATKAFVLSFTQALAYELRGSGVTATCHCPGATATKFAERAGTQDSKLFKRPGGVASAEEVARHAYRSMLRGKTVAIHGALNRAAVVGAKFAPTNTSRVIAASLNQN